MMNNDFIYHCQAPNTIPKGKKTELKITAAIGRFPCMFAKWNKSKSHCSGKTKNHRAASMPAKAFSGIVA